MDAIEALASRKSAVKLGDPAPSPEIVEQVLSVATRVPDHGKLRPWRFILIEGEDRVRFGDLLADVLRQREPDAPEPLLAKEREKPLRAPLIITVVAAVQPNHPKIPEVEQVIAAGCAAHAMMNAFHALGFGTMWKTGAPAYDPLVRQGLGLADTDQIVGFIYVGTETVPAQERPRPDWRQYTTRWTGTGIVTPIEA